MKKTEVQTSRKLKIIFAIRAVEFFYYFQSIVEALLVHGHRVKVVFDRRWSSQNLNFIEGKWPKQFELSWALYDNVRWRKFLYYFYDLLGYRRYFKIKGQSPFYKERWRKLLQLPLRIFLRIPGFERLIATNSAAEVLKFLVKTIPIEPGIKKDLIEFGPDIVVAAPANLPNSSCDLEYLRAAKKLKIPTVVPVISWDNLTTKGLIHPAPERILVWNKTQEEEAIKHQFINKNIIKITGSPEFDLWFRIKKPFLTRANFCKQYGLDPKKPILVYLGTSKSLTDDETWVVKELRKALNNAKDREIGQIQMVVRPHPYNSCFEHFKYPGVAVIPQKGSPPAKLETIKLYFDTLYWGFAVVGLNTTGLIDAIVLGKPTVSLILEKYSKIQEETEHFRTLRSSRAIEIAKNHDELIKIVGKLLKGKDKLKLQRQQFVQDFIRPGGLAKETGEVAAEEIENVTQGFN